MRRALASIVLLLVGCQTCAEDCPNTGLRLTLRSPTVGFAEVGARVRVELETNLSNDAMTCTLGESGVARCDSNTLTVQTKLAAGGRVYELGVATSTHPTRIKLTVRSEAGAIVGGPYQGTVSWPVSSEACDCIGGVDMTMQ